MSNIEITPELLANIKAKAEKATPGPWEQHEHYPLCITDYVFSPICEVPRGRFIDRNSEADAAYIATSNPQVMLALIEYIKKLEKSLDGLAHDDTEKTLEVERLEKEARWLAEQVMCCSDDNKKNYCTYDCDRCEYLNSVEDWIETARKEVADGN